MGKAWMRIVIRLQPHLASAFVLGALIIATPCARDRGPERARMGDATALHMEMTAPRVGTHADSARAAGVAALLRDALAPYADTTAAVRDGYQMFMPQVKTQKVYHFTNRMNAVKEAFRFDPAKPTSLLYRKAADGRFTLVGAMYTAPKRFSPDKLDARVPLSVASWHKHVNWCIPKKGEMSRWVEQKDGHPVFGPESPIATQGACEAVDGVFHDTLFGWMLHANVFAGNDPKAIWGDDHAGHDMHEGMKMTGDPK
jgi:hypothetical protein